MHGPSRSRVHLHLYLVAQHAAVEHLLRGEGVTGDTWDREAYGFTLKREKLKA